MEKRRASRRRRDINVRFPMYIAPSDEEAIEEPQGSIEAFFQRQREFLDYSRAAPEPKML